MDAFNDAFHIMSMSTFGVALVTLELFVPLDFYLSSVAFMKLVVDHIESNIRLPGTLYCRGLDSNC